MRFYISYLVLILLTSCVGSSLISTPISPVAYIQWVENPDNGLNLHKEVGAFQFQLQYKPHEYLAIRALRKTEIEAAILQAKVSEMEDLQYFTFQLGKQDGSDVLKSNIGQSGDYSKNIEYLSFGLQKDLKLVEERDTLPCVLHHFERSYGITPAAKIVLAFPATSTIKNKTFIYEDSHFGIGTIKMTISEQALANIPKIKTN